MHGTLAQRKHTGGQFILMLILLYFCLINKGISTVFYFSKSSEYLVSGRLLTSISEVIFDICESHENPCGGEGGISAQYVVVFMEGLC